MPKPKTDEHVINLLTSQPPYLGLWEYAWWCCTCGDTEMFRGEGAVMKAWVTAERHAKIWGGRIA